MRPSWFKISCILAGLWLVVGSILWWLESSRPSVEKVLAFVTAHPVAGNGAAADRKVAVEAVAAEYLRLSFDDRKEVLVSSELRAWWRSLSKRERRTFRLAIYPQSRQLVEFLDGLPAGQRSHSIDRLLQEVVKARGGDLKPVEKLALVAAKTMGLKGFLESTWLDESEEVLLLFHELEKRFIWSRGR